MTTRHYKKVASYKSRAEANAYARRLRASGHENVRVRRDPLTGHYIVEILFLALALGIIGGLLHH